MINQANRCPGHAAYPSTIRSKPFAPVFTCEREHKTSALAILPHSTSGRQRQFGFPTAIACDRAVRRATPVSRASCPRFEALVPSTPQISGHIQLPCRFSNTAVFWARPDPPANWLRLTHQTSQVRAGHEAGKLALFRTARPAQVLAAKPPDWLRLARQVPQVCPAGPRQPIGFVLHTHHPLDSPVTRVLCGT